MTTLIAISFDDGRGDNFAIINNELLTRKIPVTLFVTTGYIDGTCPKEKKPTQKKAIRKEDVVSLSRESCVEIGLHGDMHLNDEADIENGRQKLLSWIDYPENHVFGFASPCTGFPIQSFNRSDNALFAERISYLAMGLRISTLPKIRILARKIGRIVHIPLLYYRVPIHRDISFSQTKALVDIAVRRSASVAFMFHSIDNETDDIWSWHIDKFRRLCDYLNELRKKGQLELVTVQEFANRLRSGK